VPIKRRVTDPQTLVPPDLPSASKILAKCPLLIQFLTARSYEEGGARLPGRFWFEVQGTAFVVTLFDLDQALKVAVRAGTLDDVFAAVELLLGAENAPWEPDQYQVERRAKTGKRK